MSSKYVSVKEVTSFVICASFRFGLSVLVGSFGGPIYCVNKLSCSNSEYELSSSCSCLTLVTSWLEGTSSVFDSRMGEPGSSSTGGRLLTNFALGGRGGRGVSVLLFSMKVAEVEGCCSSLIFSFVL